MRWDEMGWDEMRWDGMRWDEMRWDERRRLVEHVCSSERLHAPKKKEGAMRWLSRSVW
jgi:hypothetical protein